MQAKSLGQRCRAFYVSLGHDAYMVKYMAATVVGIFFIGGIFFYQKSASTSTQNQTVTQTGQNTATQQLPQVTQNTSVKTITSLRQLFWEIPANSTVSLAAGGSARVGSVSLQNGQMVGSLTIATAIETKTITVSSANLRFAVSDLAFEICSVGQSEARPSGEISFSVASGIEKTLCPNTFGGESPTESKFNLAE